MARRAKIRPAGTLGSILACAVATSLIAVPAFCQDAASGAIDQVQLGDVFATQWVAVDAAPFAGGPTVVAAGNSAASRAFDGPAGFQTSQDLNATVAVEAKATVGDANSQDIGVNAAALGNVAKQASCCDAASASTAQTVEGYQSVSAAGALSAGGAANSAVVNSVAVGNLQSSWARGGSDTASTNQAHFGTTVATTTATTGVVSGEAGYSAVAVANTAALASSATSTDQTLQQEASGYETQASVVASQGQGADVVAVSAAAANLSTTSAEGGSARVNAEQASNKPVTASSDLTVQSWSGSAVSSAAGVGDSVVLFAPSGPSSLASTQANQGAVTVSASFSGGAGGEGAASASASGVGNSVYGSLCGTCANGARAGIAQVNGGGVQSTATVNGGSMGAATGSASAVGNNAAILVQKSGG